MKCFCLILSLFSTFALAEVSFDWSGTSIFDETNTKVTSATDVSFKALTILNVDLSPFVIGNKINISDIPTALAVSNINVSLSFLPDSFNTDTYSDPTNVGVGSTPYLVVHHGNGIIQVGDYIGLGGSAASTLSNLSIPPEAPQKFTSNPLIISTNIEVIPEPTTIAILLMGILGLVGFRKHLRKD
jgi:hypothetical protein